MRFVKAKERLELRLDKVTTHGGRENLAAKLRFSMPLEPQDSALFSLELPKFIVEAWKSMKKPAAGIEVIELDRIVDSQNVHFFDLPEKGREPRYTMTAVDLEKIELEKQNESEVRLNFTADVDVTKSLWDWIYYAQRAGALYADFEECQGEIEDGQADGKSKAAGAN